MLWDVLMLNCEYCRRPVPSGVFLSNGRAIHDVCFESIQHKDKDLNSKIDQEIIKLDRFEFELKKRKSFAFKLSSIFSDSEAETSKIESSILVKVHNISKLFYELETFRMKIKSIYDYFLTYPPDWKERREIVVNRDGQHCCKCRCIINLHLHHKTPLSRGGSNKTDNLVLDVN